MTDHPSSAGVRDILAALRAEFAPGELRETWEAWTGVSGLLYTRRRLSSPPVVFRGWTVEALAAQIREYEAQR